MLFVLCLMEARSFRSSRLFEPLFIIVRVSKFTAQGMVTQSSSEAELVDLCNVVTPVMDSRNFQLI